MRPRHLALGLAVAIVWGLNFVAIELGLTDTVALPLVAMRFILTAFPLVLFVKGPDAPWWVIVGVGLFMSAGQFGLLFTSMQLGLSPGLAAVVLQCQAIFTMFIAGVVLRERPKPIQVIGAGCALIGLGIVAAGRIEDSADGVAIVPLIVCIAAGLSWSIGNVIQRFAPRANGFSMVVWSALVVPLPILCLSYWLDGPEVLVDAFATIGWPTWASLAFTVGAASLFGYSVWNTLLSTYPAATVTPIALLVPPIAIIAAAIFLQELPNTLELIGSAFLVGGVAIGYIRRRQNGTQRVA